MVHFSILARHKDHAMRSTIHAEVLSINPTHLPHVGKGRLLLPVCFAFLTQAAKAFNHIPDLGYVFGACSNAKKSAGKRKMKKYIHFSCSTPNISALSTPIYATARLFSLQFTVLLRGRTGKLLLSVQVATLLFCDSYWARL